MKKIVKIITFYEDGTFSESTPSAPFSPMPSAPLTSPYPWPYNNEDVKVPYDPNKIPKWEAKNRCEKCGLKIEGIMGYVCTNNPCPCGLGGAWCGTGKLE